MPLGTEVGLGPGGIVLDGDPASPTFNSCLLWPNGRPFQQLLSSLTSCDRVLRGEAAETML